VLCFEFLKHMLNFKGIEPHLSEVTRSDHKNETTFANLFAYALQTQAYIESFLV